MIFKATQNDFMEILFIYRSCAKEMNKYGLFNWDHTYPSHEMIREDIHQGNLYILKENHLSIAVVCFNIKICSEYKNIQWKYKGKSLYVHRLAVHPGFINNKFGSTMMGFADEYASIHQFKNIRLDVISTNPAALKLYHKSGYEISGQFYFENQKDVFLCMEKEINKIPES